MRRLPVSEDARERARVLPDVLPHEVGSAGEGDAAVSVYAVSGAGDAMTLPELRVFLQDWFCGCGSPEDAVTALERLLALHPLYDNRAAFEALIPNDGMQYLMLYTLDHFDLTEHGGSVGGGWLTEKGKAVLAAIRAHDADEICAQCCIHGVAVDDMGGHDCSDAEIPS